MTRRFRLVVLLAVAGMLVLASPVGSHVTVDPREAPKGGFVKLAFRVPNERENAGTVKLEVNLPTDRPIRSVSVRPHPGWTYTVERTQLAQPLRSEGGEEVTEVASKITWTGGPIKPGEFQEFDVSVGPLPTNTDELVFKALQTYEGGEVVRWIEERLPGEEEPEHPAPVLTLVEAGGQDDRPAAAALSVSTAAVQEELDDANRLALTGIVLGALGLIAAIGALAVRRRPAS